MGHGVAKHSKQPYAIQDETQFSDISSFSHPDVPTPVVFDQPENPQNLISKIKAAVSWPKRLLDDEGSELQALVHELFEEATKIMTELSRERKYPQVEEIARSMIWLTTQWGDEVLKSLGIKSFTREMIPLKVKGLEYMIQAGEYFKPEPFYGGDGRLVKLYFFHIIESKNRIMSYYLECSHIIQPFYMLGLQVSGTHLKVETYDRSCPSYWIVRDAVLRDMQARINASLLMRSERPTGKESVEDLREGVEV